MSAAEVWKPVVDWPEYAVSNLGHVKRLAGTSRGNGSVLKSDRTLKPWKHVSGYWYVSLHRPGVKRNAAVHRLMALAFIPNDNPARTHVAHADGNPENVSLRNLRWATPKENAADVDTHGRRNRGERNGQAKLTREIVLEIKVCSETQQAVADRFGISRQTVSDIRRGRRWRHLV